MEAKYFEEFIIQYEEKYPLLPGFSTKLSSASVVQRIALLEKIGR
jgi:hypothetical protein